MQNYDLIKLKTLLEEQFTWPQEYSFKFIFPHKEKESIYNQTLMILKIQELDLISTNYKLSKNEKYISYTMKVFAKNADLVVEVYNLSQKIKGLVVL